MTRGSGGGIGSGRNGGSAGAPPLPFSGGGGDGSYGVSASDAPRLRSGGGGPASVPEFGGAHVNRTQTGPGSGLGGAGATTSMAFGVVGAGVGGAAPDPPPAPVATLPGRPNRPSARPPGKSSGPVQLEPFSSNIVKPFSSNLLRNAASGLSDGWRALSSDLATPDAAPKTDRKTGSEFTARAQQYRALQTQVEESQHYAAWAYFAHFLAKPEPYPITTAQVKLKLDPHSSLHHPPSSILHPYVYPAFSIQCVHAKPANGRV